MSLAAAQELNTTLDRRLYYIGIDRRLCASQVKLTASALFQSGYIAATGKPDENGDIINVRTRREIKDRLGISYATASRNNGRFTKAGVIEKQGLNTYRYLEKNPDGVKLKKWYCPTEILTETFEAVSDDGEVDGGKTLLKLTYSDCLVYAYFYTLLPHIGKKQTLKQTYEEIGLELGIDASTVSDSVKKLRRAGLIYFPSGWTGKNRYSKSKIGLKRNWPWFKRERQYRAELARKKQAAAASGQSPATPQKATENKTVTRKKYYDGLQAEAERKAAQTLADVLKCVDFRALNDKLTQAKYEYNRAIIYNDAAKQRELALRIAALKKDRANVLKNLGIEPEQLDAGYYVHCKVCNDTGIKRDGTACGCYKPRQRGSPTASGGNRSVGESNTDI